MNGRQKGSSGAVTIRHASCLVSHSMIDVTEPTSTMFAALRGPARAPTHRAILAVSPGRSGLCRSAAASAAATTGSSGPAGSGTRTCRAHPSIPTSERAT